MDVFFVLSKIGWFIVQPLNFVALVAGFAALAAWLGKTNAARNLVTAVAALLILPLLTPVDRVLVAPLEGRFQMPNRMPARVDGIVLLGGAQRPLLTAYHRQPELNSMAETLRAFLALARRYPAAKLVFSGGSGDIRHPEATEAETVKLFLRQQGFDASKVIYETKSRNTYENALFSKALVEPKQNEVWLMITNARTVPRAMGVFRKLDWEVTPIPCDHLVVPSFDQWISLSTLEVFTNLSQGMHEWLGLTVYYLSRRTSEFFPGP